MIGFFNRPERIFFAVIVAMSVYVFMFIYFQISSSIELIPIDPFNNDEVTVEVKDELEITPEQVEINSINNDEKLTNTVRNNADSRQKSNENWSQNSSGGGNPEQSVKDFERQLFNEAGGDKERAKIKSEAEEQKRKITSNANNKTNSSNQETKSNQFAGNVMVDFSLKGRTAYESNNWYVRNPGYTCGHGSAGTVVVLISVDNSGKVVLTSIDESRCENATNCMREQALKYASISKFNASSSKQEGYIRYRFVAQ
jgi:hypothetical protein